MARSTLSFLAVLLISSVLQFAGAQDTLSVATPESQGFSTARLNRITQMLKEYIDQKKFPGAVWLVARNGKIVAHQGVGYSDLEGKVPMSRNAIFRIASMTKAVTSVGVMILYEEGKFLLDEPVSKYLHSFKNPRVLDSLNLADTSYTTVPAKREITIRDLLTHTSGIGYPQIGSPEAIAIYAKHKVSAGIGTDRKSLAADMQLLGSLPLMHHPGEKFTYGLNTDVLGYLIEVVSGMPLDRFFRTRIFEPLGMEDTWFYLPPEKHDRLVPIYIPTKEGGLRKVPLSYTVNGPLNPDYPKTQGTYFSGGAGLSSTVLDYAKFLQMLLNGGKYNGHRILSRNTVRMMISNQIGDLSLGQNKFGLGFQLTTEVGSAQFPMQEGSYAWGGYFATAYWVDPREKLIGIIYRQLVQDPAREATNKFKVMVHSALDD